MREIYDKTIASRTGERFVSDHANNHFSALCPAIVLDDRDKAYKIGARGQRFFAEAIMHWNLHTAPPDPGSEDEDTSTLIEHEGRGASSPRCSEMNIPLNPNIDQHVQHRARLRRSRRTRSATSRSSRRQAPTRSCA